MNYIMNLSSQKGCYYAIKNKYLLKQLGNHLTLNNIYAFNMHKKKVFVFELLELRMK